MLDPSAPTWPVFKLFNAQTLDHFYTVDEAECQRLQEKGFIVQGIVGHVYRDQVSGTVPLLRLWSPRKKDHFYTLNENEARRACMSKGACELEGTMGYVYENAQAGAVPLMRFYKESECKHFYTVAEDEKLLALSHGYKEEGTAGYLLASP